MASVALRGLPRPSTRFTRSADRAASKGHVVPLSAAGVGPARPGKAEASPYHLTPSGRAAFDFAQAREASTFHLAQLRYTQVNCLCACIRRSRTRTP
jgi:hypothetical protein